MRAPQADDCLTCNGAGTYHTGAFVGDDEDSLRPIMASCGDCCYSRTGKQCSGYLGDGCRHCGRIMRSSEGLGDDPKEKQVEACHRCHYVRCVCPMKNET